MEQEKAFIAVFDSGVGGISVLRELIKEMPGENYLYYGDSANAPYGRYTTEKVRNLTMEAAEMLFSRGAKALVVACNTATAAAIKQLREAYPDKVIIGIEPALKVAAEMFPGGHIGVMATPVTLREEKFHHQLERFPDVKVSLIPAPELVELVETGHQRDGAVKAYLEPLLQPYVGKLSAVVLGCTHYPFASRVIGEILGDKTVILDGGEGTARQTRRQLEEKGLLLEGEGSIQMENSAGDAEKIKLSMTLLEQPL